METTAVHGSINVGKGKLWFGASYNSISEMNNTFSFLKENNVSIIWNLLEDDTISKVESRQFEVINTPIEDYSFPQNIQEFKKTTLEIIELLNNGKNIYVHCFAGHGRTGIAVASIRVLCGEDIKLVLSETKELVGGPETRSQELFIAALANQVSIRD
jgi:protein-tyrosine phosphatase